MNHFKFRAFFALLICSVLLYLGAPPAIAGAAGAFTFAFINPFGLGYAGAPYPAIAGSTKSGLIASGGADVQEVLWTSDVLISAAQTTPFADNMTGAPGSGKPIINNRDTARVMGNQIVFNTVDSLGAPMIQGDATRVGNEEGLNPGNFRLTVDVGFVSAAISNTGLTQTVPGANWDKIIKPLIAKRLAKQQSDDVMQDLKVEATSDNTLFSRGTIDTLSTNDTFQMSLLIGGGSRLRDLGAMPMNASKVSKTATETPPAIQRYLHFGTDAGMRPIKDESGYQEAMRLAKERGDKNNLFTGEYSDVDGQIIYPWVNVRHGAIGSIGSALQVEALLGTALGGRTANSGNLPVGSGILDGGGSSTKAAATPRRNFFEFWSLFAYTPINGVTRTFNARSSSIAYGVIIDKTVGGGKVGFFSYTGNTGNQLTGVTFLGSTTTGNYNTAVGNVTWNAGAWLTAGDGAGFLGVSDGVFASGSFMMEANSKGVPLAFAFGLGEMAVVSGYGNVPLKDGTGRTAPMAHRLDYSGPYNQAFGTGMEVCWGTAAFKRPDGITPNYVLEIFARAHPSMPVIP